jgi:hypothetical protein
MAVGLALQNHDFLSTSTGWYKIVLEQYTYYLDYNKCITYYLFVRYYICISSNRDGGQKICSSFQLCGSWKLTFLRHNHRYLYLWTQHWIEFWINILQQKYWDFYQYFQSVIFSESSLDLRLPDVEESMTSRIPHQGSLTSHVPHQGQISSTSFSNPVATQVLFWKNYRINFEKS